MQRKSGYAPLPGCPPDPFDSRARELGETSLIPSPILDDGLWFDKKLGERCALQRRRFGLAPDTAQHLLHVPPAEERIRHVARGLRLVEKRPYDMLPPRRVAAEPPCELLDLLAVHGRQVHRKPPRNRLLGAGVHATVEAL